MKISDINYYNHDSLKISIIGSLCRNSLKFLQTVFRIRKINEIRFHLERFKKTTPYLNPDFLNLSHQIYEELLIDDVKIIVAFENYLKALLLEAGYIFHEAKKRTKKPVKIKDNPKIDINLKISYGISKLISDNFWPIFCLPNSNKEYISRIIDRRNTIHLLTSKPSASPFELIEEVAVLDSLINEHISGKYVEYCKIIGAEHNTKIVNFDFLKKSKT